MTGHGTFVTSINCMDGRVQLPIISYLKNKFGVDYVDVITAQGPNKIIAEGKETEIIEAFKKRIDISIDRHHSHVIAISGHYDCAANPADKAGQLEHIKSSMQKVSTWKNGCTIIGLWVNENWQVEELK